jgi:hypothetical protein
MKKAIANADSDSALETVLKYDEYFKNAVAFSFF